VWKLIIAFPALVAIYLWWRGRGQQIRTSASISLSHAVYAEEHIAAHAFSIRHRAALVQSTECGCFYCLELFQPVEVLNWVDDNDTALCPRCGIDAVIGSSSGFPITCEFLTKMQAYWF
jgi:hypothetical protein